MWPFSKKTPVYFEDLTSCHVCGCLLVKNMHTEGRPELVERSIIGRFSYEDKVTYELKERFYCAAHHPKNQ